MNIVSSLLAHAMTSRGVNPRTKKPLKSDGMWNRETVPDSENEESYVPAPGASGANPGEVAVVAPPLPPAVDDSGPKEVTEGGDDVRFYPPLPRIAVPIADAGLHKYIWTPPTEEGATAPAGGATGMERPGYAPGTVLACDMKYSPLSRQILSVHNTRAANAPPLTRKKGVITRTGVRMKLSHVGPQSGDVSLDPALPEEALELVEIRSGDVSSDVMEDYAYCVWPLELAPPQGSVNVNMVAALSTGDEVEYHLHRHKDKEGSKPLMVAIGATLTRSNNQHRGGGTTGMDSGSGSGIVFTRPGSLNSMLQKNISGQKVSKITGHKGVVMAKGPAEDGSIGFQPGWRSQERITEWKEVPWSHLLPWQELMQVNIPK